MKEEKENLIIIIVVFITTSYISRYLFSLDVDVQFSHQYFGGRFLSSILFTYSFLHACLWHLNLPDVANVFALVRLICTLVSMA